MTPLLALDQCFSVSIKKEAGGGARGPRPKRAHAKEGEGVGACVPGMFCPSGGPSFLVRWRV